MVETFTGIVSKINYIKPKWVLQLISLGPIFATESYDGSLVLDYGRLEPHFGTDEELANMIEALHKKEMSVIADFPFGQSECKSCLGERRNLYQIHSC